MAYGACSAQKWAFCFLGWNGLTEESSSDALNFDKHLTHSLFDTFLLHTCINYRYKHSTILTMKISLTFSSCPWGITWYHMISYTSRCANLWRFNWYFVIGAPGIGWPNTQLLIQDSKASTKACFSCSDLLTNEYLIGFIKNKQDMAQNLTGHNVSGCFYVSQWVIEKCHFA